MQDLNQIKNFEKHLYMMLNKGNIKIFLNLLLVEYCTQLIQCQIGTQNFLFDTIKFYFY